MESSQSTGRRFTALLALAERARGTFERFPFVLLAGVAAAGVAHRLASLHFDSAKGADPLVSVLVTCVLGIPLFFALHLLGESRSWSRRFRLAAVLAGLAALVGYYLTLPVPMKQADAFRFVLLALGLHLWVAFVPFVRRAGEENGFWQYNKVLFLRFAAAALYSSVLYIGLVLAILASDALLGLDFGDEIYTQLWFWIVFVYNTWFFLAGIPSDVRALQHVRDYPVALRIFTQYVLIPLVVVYLVILYAYTGKIIIEWNLPKGWVGYPVIGVSVTGVLALLLVHPIRERAENARIVTYGKFFYWALFPLIGLIAVAIGTRIGDYGITEKRYLVVVATAWLLGIALYFSLARKKSIRTIPVSLCMVVLLSAFGPWGATSVSRRSQLGRLRQLLIAEEVMTGGRLEGTRKQVDFDSEKEISNIVKYLHDVHGLESIRDWYAQPERLPDEPTVEVAMAEMGLEFRNRWEEAGTFSIGVERPNPVPVGGFDYAYRLMQTFHADSVHYRAALDSATELSLDGTTLRVSRAGEPAGGLSVDLAPTIRALWSKERRGEPYGAEEATLAAEGPLFELVVYLESANGKGGDDAIALDYISATVLVGVK